MKKLLLSLVATFSSLLLTAQSPTWTKDDRNNLFEDCLSYCTKYKNITNEQKESISLCYLEEITKKYDKSDFQAKIDIEVKRIKDSQIGQCAKNIGVDLSTQTKKEETVVENKPVAPVKNLPTKQALIGRWKADDNSTIEFKSDGTYVKKYMTRFVTNNKGYIVDNVKSGDWFLDEKGFLTLRLNWKEEVGLIKPRIKNYTSNYEYRFISFTADYIKFENTQYEEAVVQANKIE